MGKRQTAAERIRRRMRLSPAASAALGAGLIMLLLVGFYLFSMRGHATNRAEIVLPSESVAESDSMPSGQIGRTDAITIGIENVQTVIASLTRPEHYTIEVVSTLYYKEQTTDMRAVQYAKNGAMRTELYPISGTNVQIQLRYQDALYAWISGAASYYRTSVGAFSSDDAALLPTYEDVLTFDTETIADAGTVNLDYEPCIYVKTEQDGKRADYWVSTVTGLLRRAEFYQDDVLFRRVTVGENSTAEPDDALFALPGGAYVWNVA